MCYPPRLCFAQAGPGTEFCHKWRAPRIIPTRSDRKWEGYLDWCDRFHFAVEETFPQEVLPHEHGLILADAWHAEIVRESQVDQLAPARRKSLTLRAAQTAAMRLRSALDPGPSALSER